MLRNVPRQEVLQKATARSFDGGLNLIDNELSLKSKYSVVMDNVYRNADGSVGVRYGTRYLAKTTGNAAMSVALGTAPLSVETASYVITVTKTNHGLISGQSITISGLLTIGGIAADKLNGVHIVTVNDANEFYYTIDVASNATTTGGGNVATYTNANNNTNGDIINCVYFDNYIVFVTSAGEVGRVSSSGSVYRLFDDTIASQLSGSPNGWSTTSFVSFATFNGQLIICNGIDKPLICDFSQLTPVTYLSDVGGSNLNVPICRYVIAMNHHVVMAGDPINPDLVHISGTDTALAWTGDIGVVGAAQVSLSKVSQSISNTVRGLMRYRNQCLVAFDDVIVVGTLGVFNDAGAHTPTFEDQIDEHGSISHRSIVSLGNDIYTCDNVGVPSIARATITNALKPSRVSRLVDPLIRAAISQLSIGSCEDNIFAIFNKRDDQYWLFIPNNDVFADATETTVYVYTVNTELNMRAWSTISGWKFKCACRTMLDNIVLAEGDRFYIYGSPLDPIHEDFVADPSVPTAPISFAWELPWNDMQDRMVSKHLRYIAFDTYGTGLFTVDAFVDNYYVDSTGTRTPQLSTEFVGGDQLGFGGANVPFGSGRRSSNELLWAYTTKFRLIKLRFYGTVSTELGFVSISLLYHTGSIRR